MHTSIDSKRLKIECIANLFHSILEESKPTIIEIHGPIELLDKSSLMFGLRQKFAMGMDIIHPRRGSIDKFSLDELRYTNQNNHTSIIRMIYEDEIYLRLLKN
jgi:hypothetical protein